MKILLLIALLLAELPVLHAQEDVLDISLPLKTGQKAILNLQFAEKIDVKTWDKKELFIRAHVSINHGLLNEAHKVDTVFSDDTIEISTGFDEEILRQSRFINCDGKNKTQYNYGRNRGYSICHTINYEVFLPQETDLKLETISGNIAIPLMNNELVAESVSGTIDVIVAKNQKADITLETVSGRAYAEPPMVTREDGLQLLLTRKIRNQLNGGGKKIDLKSVSGDVRLRYP